MDVNLSTNDEDVHPPMPDAPADQKMLAGIDAGDDGVTSAEPTAPGPIGSGVPEKFKPSTADQVLAIPPSGRCGRKCLHAATRRSNPVPPADQVMTEVELPPYRGPRCPLDSVAIEIIFGRIFVVVCDNDLE
jgi:hypothetical protein